MRRNTEEVSGKKRKGSLNHTGKKGNWGKATKLSVPRPYRQTTQVVGKRIRAHILLDESKDKVCTASVKDTTGRGKTQRTILHQSLVLETTIG